MHQPVTGSGVCSTGNSEPSGKTWNGWVSGVKLSPPFVLTRMRNWMPGPPNEPVAGSMTTPTISSPPPNGHAFAAPMAGTSEVPVARPVTSLMVGTGMLPIASSTGPRR